MEGGGADLPADGRVPLAGHRPDPARGLEQGYAAAMAELLDLRRELAAVHASRSWRLTAPLRGLRTLRAYLRRHPAEPGAAAAPAATTAPPAAPAALPVALPEALPVRATVIAPPGATTLADIPAGLGFTVLAAPDAAAAEPAAAINRAATGATGEWIVVWDGRSTPQPGWLGALAGCFDAFPKLGMAGATLLDAAGRIVAAGAALAPDGTVLPLGAGARPAHPDHSYAATVDTCPAGAAMLPAALWRDLGGLDPAIASLDHALADLALRLRAAGFGVVRQPTARLVRPQATPAAPWTEALGRWHVRRRRIAQAGGLAALGLGWPAAPRVLFVDHFVPTPDRDSGSADLHALLRLFVGFGWEPTLLPVSDLDRADGYVDDLRARGVRVATGGGWRDLGTFLAADRRAFDLFVVSRVSLARGTAFAMLRRHSPQASVVFNTVDLHFLRQERAALLERSAAGLDEAFRVQQMELGAIAAADRTILMSEAERELIAELLPHARTCVIPIMRDIPGRAAPFGPRHGVVFIGGFRHLPNVDAVLFFVREVWPKLAGRLQAKLTIVGADAPAEVQALAGPDVELPGHVADLGAVLAGCRLTVAPLRYGAGIKGKVVSSLAAGVPCVATPIAAEGMGLNDGVNARIAADPAAFAQAVLEVYEQPELWQRLSDAGLAYARRTFSLAAARPRVAALLADLGLPLPAGESGA